MGGKERSPPGGTAALLALIDEHRAAVTWDLRRYHGLSIDDLGVVVSWREAIDLVNELIKETGSHLYAEQTGLRFAASQADLASILHAEAFVNANRDRAKSPEPFRLPSPLIEAGGEAVSDEELAEGRALLKKYSMFAE